jgi:hypothetical protein
MGPGKAFAPQHPARQDPITGYLAHELLSARARAPHDADANLIKPSEPAVYANSLFLSLSFPALSGDRTLGRRTSNLLTLLVTRTNHALWQGRRSRTMRACPRAVGPT